MKCSRKQTSVDPIAPSGKWKTESLVKLAPRTLMCTALLPLLEHLLCVGRFIPLVIIPRLVDAQHIAKTFPTELARPVTLPAGHIMLAAPAVAETLGEELVAQSLLEEMALGVRLPGLTGWPVHGDVKLRVARSDAGQAFAGQCQRSGIKDVQTVKDDKQNLGGETGNVEFRFSS